MMGRRELGGVVVGLMFVVPALLWSRLPERIPTHWNLRGEVDGWSDRWPGAFVPAFIALALWVLMPVLRRVDPRREHYERFDSTFWLWVNGMVLFMAVVQAMVLLAALGHAVDVGRVILALLGVLFTVIGNVMPRIRSNWWMGIRTPWTLADERVWRGTHRVAGWSFVAGGLVALLSMVLPLGVRAPVAIGALLLAGFVPAIWSFVLWRRSRAAGG
jgi:uncharacterized membrane protein